MALKLPVTYRYVCTCVSSCLTFGETVCRSTDTDRAACRSGWGGASTEYLIAWMICHIVYTAKRREDEKQINMRLSDGVMDGSEYRSDLCCGDQSIQLNRFFIDINWSDWWFVDLFLLEPPFFYNWRVDTCLPCLLLIEFSLEKKPSGGAGVFVNQKNIYYDSDKNDLITKQSIPVHT